jgi:hypothetical protein
VSSSPSTSSISCAHSCAVPVIVPTRMVIFKVTLTVNILHQYNACKHYTS